MDEDAFYRALGAALRRRRIQLGLTQEKVATELRGRGYPCTAVAIVHYEKGRRRLFAHRLPVIAKVLQTSVDALLREGTDECKA